MRSNSFYNLCITVFDYTLTNHTSMNDVRFTKTQKVDFCVYIVSNARTKPHKRASEARLKLVCIVFESQFTRV